MKNFNDRILKALAIIISFNLVVYGVASTASASLLDIAEENEWADEDVPYEDYEDADHDEEPYEPDEEYEEDSEGEDGGFDPDDEDYDWDEDTDEDTDDSDFDPEEDEDYDGDDEDYDEDEDFDDDEEEEDDEEDLALLFADASVAEVDTYEELVAAINNIEPDGTIQLTADIDTEAMLEIVHGRIITIDLNGYTLDRGRTSADADGHVILVDNGGSLTLTDTSEEGTGLITGGFANSGGGIYNNGKLYIEGITISGNSISLSDSTYNGGAIYSSDYQGGGIYNSNTLTISNATICGNTGFGGGIFNDKSGVLTMDNVELYENEAPLNAGGAIANLGSLNILDGCDITENYAQLGGGGIFNVGSIQILGSNSICDNESDQGPDNVFQMHGAVIDNEFYPKSEHP